jgi:hypothetical protein
MKFLSESLGEVTIRFQYFCSEEERERAAKAVKRRLTAYDIEDILFFLQEGSGPWNKDEVKDLVKVLTFQPEPDETKCIVEFNGVTLEGKSRRNPEDRCYKPVARAVALEAALEGVPRDIKVEIHSLWRSRPGLDGKPVNRT